MGLYRRNKTYWFSVKMNGEERIYQSLKTAIKKVAEKRYAKKLTEIVEGTFFEKQAAKSTTYDELVKRYSKSHKHSRDKTSLVPLDKFFKGKSLHELMTTDIVAQYQEQRLTKLKPATVYQELALLRRMFNVARKKWHWSWLKENPVSLLEIAVGKSNWRYRWLSLEEEIALLKACEQGPEWLKPLVILALQTGMRRGEILALTGADFEPRFVHVRKSKNGEPRSIPMSAILLATVKAMKVRSISGNIFSVNINQLRWQFQKAMKAAKIESFRFHDLRHTFATRLVQYGVDLYPIQKVLGHKGPEMTQRYAHHVRESITPAIAALDRFYEEHAECYKSVTFDKADETANSGKYGAEGGL